MINKNLIILGIVALIVVSGVSAYENLDKFRKYSCEIIRPATEFRAEKSFGFIGIFGRFSDGSLQCFIPNKRNKPVVETVKQFVCNSVTTCEPTVCKDEQSTCKIWNYRTVCTGHGHDRHCHDEKTTCKFWNYKTVCAEPVCTTKDVCS